MDERENALRVTATDLEVAMTKIERGVERCAENFPLYAELLRALGRAGRDLQIQILEGAGAIAAGRSKAVAR